MVRMLSAGLCLVGWLCCVESGKVGTLGYSLRACGVRARDDEVGVASCRAGKPGEPLHILRHG